MVRRTPINGTGRNVLLRPNAYQPATSQRMGSEADMGRATRCALWDVIDGQSTGVQSGAELRVALESALRAVVAAASAEMRASWALTVRRPGRPSLKRKKWRLDWL